ncbi:hypothetical protein CSQ79_06835 [Gloeocapsopsis sp. IPPAS B-1203]|nr:hypothetical protein CSQ79_06835 [Gloeocapsopsis sp. IPPAS B-1203]
MYESLSNRTCISPLNPPQVADFENLISPPPLGLPNSGGEDKEKRLFTGVRGQIILLFSNTQRIAIVLKNLKDRCNYRNLKEIL